MSKLFLAIFFLCPLLHSKTENLGIFIPKRLDYVLGQDGSTPVEVIFKSKKKKTIWTYGDTLLGQFKGPVLTTTTLDFNSISDIKAMPPNTLAITDVINEENFKNLNINFLTDNSDSPTEFIKYEDGENPFIKRIWANDGIQIKNNLYVYYMDIEIDSKTAGNFFIKGSGLVKAVIPEMPEINSFEFKRTNFYIRDMIIGDSVIKHGRYLYILGRFSKNNTNVYTSMFIARTKPMDIEGPKKYEFLSKSGKWVKEKEEILDDVNGELSLIYDKYEKKFRIIYINTSTKIKQIKSKKIEDLIKNFELNTVKDLSEDGKLYYSAKEVFYTKKHIYIIYMDPSIYQPVIIRFLKKTFFK